MLLESTLGTRQHAEGLICGIHVIFHSFLRLDPDIILNLYIGKLRLGMIHQFAQCQCGHSSDENQEVETMS